MIDLTEDQCWDVLSRGEVAHLGCLSDGVPYVTPLSYVVIDGTLYIRTAPGRRVDAMLQSPRVCLEVTLRDDKDWESAIVFGDAVHIADIEVETRVYTALMHKYGEEPLSTSTPRLMPREFPVFSITPDEVTGKASGSGFAGRTRPGRI
jgi:nitroimidazol reductase NimA-like FMN-containing flavoprotein (pyridoxamine 5'-phosphate oxidase superfamily)